MRTPKLYLRLDVAAAGDVAVRLAVVLGIPPVHAEGHYLHLLRALVAAGSDGDLAPVADATLERAAAWPGVPGAFAAAVRAAGCDPAGHLAGWRSMTAAQRHAAADRTAFARRTGRPAPDTRSSMALSRPSMAESVAGYSIENAPISTENGAISAENATTHKVVTKKEGTQEDQLQQQNPMRRRTRQRRQRPASAPAEEPQATWITPYFDAWAAAYPGSAMSVEPNVKPLAALEDEQGHPEVLRRWTAMLARKPASVANGWMLRRAWSEFGLTAEDGGQATRLRRRAQKFLGLVLKHGLASMDPTQRAAKIEALVEAKEIVDVETFRAALKRCDMPTLRNTAVEAFALKHVEERAGDVLSA